MNRIILSLFLFTVITFGLIGSSNAASAMYGIGGSNGLFLIDDPIDGGSITPIGNPDNTFKGAGSMSIRPSDNTFFVWCNFDGTDGLFTINPTTGEGTKHVDTWGTNPYTGQIQPCYPDLGAIAYGSDGFLYGAGVQFWKINPTTGEITDGDPIIGMHGMDFGIDGNLYGVATHRDENNILFNSLFLINPVTAQETNLGNINMSLFGDPSYFNFGSLVTSPDGTLIVSARTSTENYLFDINHSDASVSNIRTVALFPQGLGFAPVPIPSAIWLLGSGLIGLVGFRRKFKKA